jgi:hypothetical protein
MSSLHRSFLTLCAAGTLLVAGGCTGTPLTPADAAPSLSQGQGIGSAPAPVPGALANGTGPGTISSQDSGYLLGGERQ